MYLIETDITINWTIHTALNKVLVKADFDIVVMGPDGISTYFTDPGTGWVQPINWAGVHTPGALTYTFNQTEAGRYTVHLVTGTDAAYTILDTAVLNVRCATPATIITDLSANSIMHAPAANCIVTGQSLVAGNFDGFAEISSVGRHATPGKLVFTGRHASDGNQRANSIGIIDRASGDIDITTHRNAFDADMAEGDGGGMDTRGIDCDRSTGRYVVILNYYIGLSWSARFHPWYSDDLINWTEATVDVDQILQTTMALWYDDNLEMWVWVNDKEVLLSLDGETWTAQKYVSDAKDTPIYGDEFCEWGAALPSWHTPNQDRIFVGKQRNELWMIQPTPGVIPATTVPSSPATSQSVLLNGYDETLGSQLREEIYDIRINQNISSLTYWDGWIYAVTALGCISRTQTGDFKDGFWEEFIDTLPSGPSDLDAIASTWKSFMCIEGVFWIRKAIDISRDTWYRYDDAVGVPPTGANWVQDSTGPREQTRNYEFITYSGMEFSMSFDWPDEGWALINNDKGTGGTGDFWIVYNEN